MINPTQYAQDGLRAGCTTDQMQNFIRAGLILQPRQLAASAAARLCDHSDGPTLIGYGGARGGGKSHWLLAQVGADDCQRFPGCKALLLRKTHRLLVTMSLLRRMILGGRKWPQVAGGGF
jgi:hypothetical protein